MPPSQRHIIAILLENEAGALARVAGLFANRGYNIESLSVAATHDAKLSRLTLTTRGEAAIVDQIVKQLRKQVDVLDVADLTQHAHLECELVIAKVRVRPGQETALEACLARHHATPIEHAGELRSVQYAGHGAATEAFLSELEATIELLELTRSGTAALAQGAQVLGLTTPVHTYYSS